MSPPRSPSPPAAAPSRRLLLDGLVGLLLAALTAAAYAGVTRCGFVFDDIRYVVENPRVQQGLDGASLRWALTSGYAANWHPLTWLSHMLDVRLFGLEPLGHHLHSVALHIAATLLLYGVLRGMTGARWRSAFAAGLFALHPTHVESVAWVAERKDVLSALFWVLTLGAYARYASRPGRGRYAVVLLLLALGLMAKQMLVTLPFVLLLLDVWPLGRLRLPGGAPAGGEPGRPAARWRGSPTPLARLVVEKLPLLALAVAASVAAWIAQSRGGALAALETFPLSARIQNALVSYAAYCGKLLWPAGLSVYYPFRSDLPPWQVAGALALLVVVSAWALRSLRRRPYLAVGWLWFLGALVPVIGLAQIGRQAMADRYTYLPSIGFFVALAWLVPDLLSRTREVSRVLLACGTVVLLALALRTHRQVGVWESGVTLFEHALAVTGENPVAENNLGEALVAAGRLPEALPHFQRAAQLRPDYALAHSNLGAAALDLGRIEEAIEHNRTAVELEPGDALHRVNLGSSLGAAGRWDEAAEAFGVAIRLDPGNAPAHVGLGRVRAAQGRLEEAAASFEQAVALDPTNVTSHLRLALRRSAEGRVDDAVGHLTSVLQLQPDHPVALAGMGTILVVSGRPAEALEPLVRAVALAPQLPDARVSLAHALLAQGQVEQASQSFAVAVQLTTEVNDEFLGYGWTLPQQARLGLGHTLAAMGRPAQALEAYEAALALAPDWPPALAGLAWLLATTEDDGLRDPGRAATLAAQACRLTSDADPKALDALAAAQAGLGRFEEAVRAGESGISAARAMGRERLAASMLQRVEGYRQQRAFRQRALDLSE